MNGLSSVDKTDLEYSLATTDDQFIICRSEVKGQGHSRPSTRRSHPRRRWGVEVDLLVLSCTTTTQPFVYGHDMVIVD